AVLYLDSAWHARRPGRAGWFLALAIACRPANMLFAWPLFFAEWWRKGRSVPAALAFAGPIALVVIALAAHNYVRFSDFTEFGHRFLDIRWQARMQTTGMFGWTYLSRHLRCLFTLMPVLAPAAPFFKVSIHGMALWLS